MKDKNRFWNKAVAEYDNRSTGFRKNYQRLAKRIARDLGPVNRILDVGTGTGEMALAVALKASAVAAIDLTPEMIERAEAKAVQRGCGNIRFSVQDASCLGFGDCTFDAVIASNLLHVIDMPEQVLREIHRVLVPGGLLAAPTFLHGENPVSLLTSLFCRIKGFPVHHRFSTKSLARRINRSGFKVISQTRLPGIIPLSYVMARSLDPHCPPSPV